MANLKRQPTITNKVVAFIIAIVFISNLTIGIISYLLHKNQSISSRAVEAERIAITMASGIDGDRFEEIMNTMEKNDYWIEVKDYADKICVELGTAYLYIIDKNYTDEVTYFAEGTLYTSFDLGTTEAVDVFADEMFETLRTGKASLTEPYPSGEYGDMVSGFAAIFNSRGEVSGVVGVDFFFDDVMHEANMFGIKLLVILLAFLIVFSATAIYIGTNFVGKPLSALDEAAKQMACGDLDIDVNITTKSEIGRLSNSFNLMVNGVKSQVKALETISSGDFTVHIEPRGEKDTMNKAITKITENINEILVEINSSAKQVTIGANQISNSSQTLASGSAEQAASVEELSAYISEVTEKTDENVSVALKAADLADEIKKNAEKGSEQMGRMTQAVSEINEASVSIGKVIKVIDDIAFQTNILALNAAVEAARAGEHGKGFAVVAEEVRNLASKSSEAAKDTSVLIENSMQKAELGAAIAQETETSFNGIIQGINESALLVNRIAQSIEEQKQSMSQITEGMGQVSDVVQQNSAIAEQSAAASEEMNGQSVMLHEMVEHFKIKE